jgi:hypothetical protein
MGEVSVAMYLPCGMVWRTASALADCHPDDVESFSACMAMRSIAGAGVARIQGGIDENVCCV